MFYTTVNMDGYADGRHSYAECFVGELFDNEQLQFFMNCTKLHSANIQIQHDMK